MSRKRHTTKQIIHKLRQAEVEIAKGKRWQSHANIATTRLYDGRRSQPEDSPKFLVSY